MYSDSTKQDTNQPTPFPDEWVVPSTPAMPEPKGSLITQRQEGIPAFIGKGAECFKCSHCRETLIEGYSPRYFVALPLQCAKCGETSTTPAWLGDEPLAQDRLTLAAGTHHASQCRKSAQITTEHEVWRVSERLRPNLEVRLDPIGDLQGLKRAYVILQSIGEQNFASQLKQARSAQSRGHDANAMFPLAAAYLECERIVKEQAADLTTNTYEAIVLLNFTLLFILQWQRHPLAKNILGALIGAEFHHTLAMLAFAMSLAHKRIEFGFLVTRGENGRAPDMFINISPSERFAVEIKAPERFQWPRSPDSAEDAKKMVLKAAENARGQIQKMKTGVLVIGATFGCNRETESHRMMAEFDAELATAVEAAINSNRGISSKIAEIKTVSLNLCPPIECHPSGWKQNGLGGQERCFPNPKYAGRS